MTCRKLNFHIETTSI